MSIIVGISGAARNAAAAVCDGGKVVAVCEQERVTRTRQARLRPGRLPDEALDAVLGIAGRKAADVAGYGIAEAGIQMPAGLSVEYVDHHLAHATTAFFTSPFQDAVVLVCDRHGDPDLTVWRGDANGLTGEPFPWTGPSFARTYSQAAEAFGFASSGDEYRIEAFAHVARSQTESPLELVHYRGDRLEVPPTMNASITARLSPNGRRPSLAQTARVAHDVQRHLGEVLLELIADVKGRFGGRHLCLGGGLFYNSYFNTLVAKSGLFERTFVPVNPGTAGVSVGAALSVARQAGEPVRPALLSPFLGPEYDGVEIKATLDNCKLSYDCVRDDQSVERTVRELARGKLVGWFQGRMEWGPRALGNRSILASPVAPFVLENLNMFLKKREPHRSYSVSICAEDLPRFFRGPAASDFMQYQYEVLDPGVLRALLPFDATSLRVQTVPASAGLFHTLLKAFGAETGVPMLVNTSFNGFNEPIVCTPRDAVRVFYGTGLDMAVIGGFLLHK